MKINYKYFGENPVGTEPCDPTVSGDSLDHLGYYEAHLTRYCGFDPSQSQWISVIFLAFSLPEYGIVLPRSVGYNVFVPWAPPDSKNRSKPADRIKWFTYYVNSSFINLFTPFQYTNDTAFRFYK